VHAWLQSLTRPDDPVLWAGVALVAGYALVGAWLGRGPGGWGRRSGPLPAGPSVPQRPSPAAPPPDSSSRWRPGLGLAPPAAFG